MTPYVWLLSAAPFRDTGYAQRGGCVTLWHSHTACVSTADAVACAAGTDPAQCMVVAQEVMSSSQPEASDGEGSKKRLRVHLGGATVLVRPPWLRSTARRSFRGDELAEKLLYVEATVSGVNEPQRTAACTPSLSFSTSLPTIVWDEKLEFNLDPEEATDGVLRLRLMEKDLLRPESTESSTGAAVARTTFKAQSGLLTCPDLTVAGSEPGQRNLLYFMLDEHNLRFFNSKQAAEQRVTHDDAPDGTFELALASSVKISSKFTNCFEMEMAGKSGAHLQLFIAETHELAMAWVERIDALLPTRRGPARLHYSDGTLKRTLVWQYNSLCILKDHVIETSVAVREMQRARLVTTHDLEIVANDGRAFRFSTESAADACTWVSVITGGDPRFDSCIGHGAYELAAVAEGCGAPAHDTWIRLAAKDVDTASASGSGDTSRTPGGATTMYGCVRVGILHLSQSELIELDTKITGDGNQQVATAADWLQLQDAGDDEVVRDDYGFSMTGAQMKREWRHMRDRIKCLQHYREAQWLNFRAESQAHNDLALGVGATGSPSVLRQSRAFAALIRLGVPRYLRPTVWLAHTGAATRRAKAEEGAYRKLVAEFERSSRASGGPIDGPRATAAVIRQQIEKDLTRTFEGECTRVNSAVGKSWLKNILGAYSISNSSIGYCQSMNFLAACLLMYLDEEDAFWMLSVICEELAEGYYTPGLPGLQVDIRVLADLLRSLHPELWSLLQQCEVPLDLICSQWLMGLFSMNLPLETLFLLWDALFLHGHDILLAAVLAVLSLALENEKFARAEAFEDVVLLLKSADFFATLATDSVFFMDAVWEQMDLMSSVDLAGMRERHRAQVASEVVRSTALQEVHTLLGQMADADTDGAVRLEMSRAIRDLQQEVRDVKIQKIELERRLGNMVAASPIVQRRRRTQPPEGRGVRPQSREETASLTATQQRYDIEQAGIEQLQVDSARLQASIKDLHNQLGARKNLLAKLVQVPESDFTERSKKDTVASVASGITLCGEIITGLCSDKAIAEASIKARTDMAKASNEAGGLYALLASSREDVENAAAELRAGKQSMQDTVRNHFASLRQALDAREANLLGQVDEVFEDGCEYLGQTASSVEDLIADLSAVMAASGEDRGGAQTDQLRSIIRSSSEAHATINQGMQNWVEQQPRCWLDEDETQWLGDRILSYGQVGTQQPVPICTSVVPLAGGQTEERTNGWPPAMPGWRVSHFSLDSCNVFATDTHILLQDDDVVSLVLETMRRKPDDRSVQQNGVTCLRHITAAVESQAQPQSGFNISRCMELGAVATIADAMRRHRSALTLQLEGCCFLLNLSAGQGSTVWSQFVPCGGPQLLLDAIENHADSVDAVTSAAGCLRAILPSNADGPFEGWDALMQSVAVNSDGAQSEDFAVVTRATQDLLSASNSIALLVHNLQVYSESKDACENLFAVLGFLVQVYNHDVDAWSIEFNAIPFKEAIGVALRSMEMQPAQLWLHESALFYISCACSTGPAVGTPNDPSMDPTRRQLLDTNKYFVREILRHRGEGSSGGGPFTVLASMRRHLDSPAVQGWSCSIIRPLVVLSQVDESTEAPLEKSDRPANALLLQLKEMGIAALVLGSMRCHPSSANVQESAMAALHTLCLADRELLAEAVKDDGIAAAAAAMRAHSTAERVQSSGCCVLWAMLSGPEGAVDSLLLVEAQEDLMGLVLSTMRNYATSSAVTANAMGLLNILVGTDGHITVTQIEDGVLLVLGAMLCHKDDARVQANACSALCELMLASDAAMRHIVSAGGIALVLQSMQSHQNSEGCVTEACLALEGFALADDKNVRTILGNDKRNVQVIDVSEEEVETDEEAEVASGGDAPVVAQILAAMATHSLCAPLLAAACRSLLALSPGFAAQPLGPRGGMANTLLPAVLGALSRHQSHAGIHQYGCLLLSELGREAPWRERLLAEPDCASTMVASLKTHQGAHNLEAVMKALRRVIPLISHGGEESVKTEVVELTFRAMRLRGESRVLQAAACSNIWQLIEEEVEHYEEPTESSAARQRARLLELAADNSDTVLAAVRAHNDSPPVLENGFRILGLLAEEMEHVRAELGADGVVSVVLGAILEYQSKHRGIPMGTLLSACECLGALGKRTSANQRALLEEGAVRLLINVVKRNVATNLSLAIVAAKSLHAMAPLQYADQVSVPAGGASERQSLVEPFVQLLMHEEAMPLLLALLRASAAAAIAEAQPMDGATGAAGTPTDTGSGWRNRGRSRSYTGGAKDTLLVSVASAGASVDAATAATDGGADPAAAALPRLAAEMEAPATSPSAEGLRRDAVLLILWQQLCELLLLLPEKALSRTLHRESIDLDSLREVVARASAALSVAATAAGVDAKFAALQSLGELVPVLSAIVMPSKDRASGRSSPVDDARAAMVAGPNLSSPGRGAGAGEGAHRAGVSRQRATSDAVEEMGGKLLRFLRG